ncbi:MAG TPA: PLD nuclease N-terminal domain-containing protein [Ktedonobacteraceae bacterium]|nr:PLD nuclease N-terminal domain-containing protein [Ktedonobacteraceae bacterium]
MEMMAFSVFSILMCSIGIIAILGSIFWVWMIVDCANNEPTGSNDKIVWLLVIILVHFVGALVYYFVRRPERIRIFGR